MSAASIMITTSAIIGASLADKAQYATLGVGMTFFAMMLCSYPMSVLMGKIGRRGGFVIGMGVALVGTLLISYSIARKDFGLYCASSFVMGCGMSCGQYLRFAAVEVAGKLYKGKAISYVLAGGIVAAFLGPNLARLSRNWLQTEFSGTYLCSALLFTLIILVLLFVRFPDVVNSGRASIQTSLKQIMVRPVFVVAVLSGLTAYASMNLIMTATPLSMHHNGHEFSTAAVVIQWHIFAMFIPSLFTGSLIKAVGLIQMMIIGALLVIVCTLVNLAGATYGHFALALILLGVGWNFLFVGATQLLTSAYSEQEKSRVQGFNDFLITLSVSITAFSSGWFLSQLGWRFMNYMVLAVLTATLLILILFLFSPKLQKSYAE